LSRLLDGCEIEALAAEPARRAGALRRTLADVIGPVDATVVETAVRRGAAVVTSDRNDVEQLAVAARRRVQIIDI
jgi:predicted nucleic acid-binding protein